MTENRWGLWSAIAFVLIAAALGGMIPSYDTGLLTQMLIYGIFAMSLDVLHGYTGMPSLGHAAYFGLAAYVTAICTLKLGWGFAAAGSAGIAASAIAAALFHLLALRTSHSYYLMITLAFSQVLWSLAVSWTDVTGGDNGMPGMARPHIGSVVAGLDHRLFLFRARDLRHRRGDALYLRHLAFRLCAARHPRQQMRMRALGYHVWAYKYLACDRLRGLRRRCGRALHVPQQLRLALDAQRHRLSAGADDDPGRRRRHAVRAGAWAPSSSSSCNMCSAPIPTAGSS